MPSSLPPDARHDGVHERFPATPGMTDAERMVWCAAFGTAVAAPDMYWSKHASTTPGADDDLIDGARREEAKARAARAVRLLGGPSRHLNADSMMLAATAEHGRAGFE